MIEKIGRSIQKRGVLGTLREIVIMSAEPFRNPHLRMHLFVPWEMVRNPRHAVKWAHDRFSSAGPAAQGLPWIAWPCIDFMADYVQPTHRVFEWGGGGSTLFFLKKGCRVTTVESSMEWVKELEQQISALGAEARNRWDLRFVAIAGNSDRRVSEYIGQVAVGAPWDLVMVDGWSRQKCLLEGMHYVKAGGVLVLDNANQKQLESVPGVLRSWERHKFRGLGVARSWVTQTDAYVRAADDASDASG